jgi:cyclohexyl-isocyanide hydratase
MRVDRSERKTAGAGPDFTIAIVLYPQCDLLDVAGPNEIFTFLVDEITTYNVQVVTVAKDARPLPVIGALTVTASHTFATCPKVDVLFVPGGGPGLDKVIGDPELMDFLRKTAAESRYVTSVCTGALLLASAGLLDGYQATAHWAVIDCLRLFPNVKVVNGCPRYVRDRNRITGGGISSSIDESLYIAETIVADLTGDPAQGTAVAQRLQLTIQYHPQPPPGGDPCSVPYDVYAPVADGMKGFRDEVCRAVRTRLAG